MREAKRLPLFYLKTFRNKGTKALAFLVEIRYNNLKYNFL